MMTNTGKEYEKLTQAIFNWINNLKRDDIEIINVQHNVTLQGKDTSHQIDVYWEFRIGVVTHRVVVQAKDLTRKVNKGQMITFKGVLEDLPGVAGVFVTTVGYASGALDVARANQIGTYVLRAPTDSDWDGLMKTLHVNLCMRIPFCEAFSINVDGNWVVEQGIDEQILQGQWCDPTLCAIIDESGNKKALSEILENISVEVGVGEKQRTVEYGDEVFLTLDGDTKLKIKSFSGRFGLRELEHEICIDGGNFLDLILRNIANGKVEGFFNRDMITNALN